MEHRIRPIITFLIIVLVSLTAVFGPAFGLKNSDPAIIKARDFLKSSQAEDGSIGTYSDTAWVVMSLEASGAGHTGWVEEAISYLKDNPYELEESYNLAADLARNILCVLSAGLDPSSFGGGNQNVTSGDYVSALVATHDGTQFGVPDSINEDCWAVMALIEAGYAPDSQIITTTVSYIEDNQSEDGGWSWATPFNDYYFESDPDNTAAAIMALKSAGRSSHDPVIKKGLEYLESIQDESGGFGSYGVVNSGSTAWVVSALNALDINPAEWEVSGKSPIDYLKSMQAADGSFKFADPLPDGYLPMSEKMTADAIIALTANTYPVIPALDSRFPFAWIVGAGALLLLGTGAIIFFKRKG